VPSLLAALAGVPDHRRAAGRRHALPAVLTFVCCGMLCGCRSLLALAEWGRANAAWCCAVFGLRRRTPCVNTLHRVLRGLDVGAFEAALRAWLAPQLGAPVPLEPLAIDGKTIRGAKTQPLPGSYLLSAFASRRGAVLAQLAIGQRESELTQAIPLLQQVELNDVLVTGDAMFAQRALCAHIVAHGGHYLLEVKDNQPMLLLAIQHCFRARARGCWCAHRGRRAWPYRDPYAARPCWPGDRLAAVARSPAGVPRGPSDPSAWPVADRGPLHDHQFARGTRRTRRVAAAEPSPLGHRDPPALRAGRDLG
jgi:hypothetical protein